MHEPRTPTDAAPPSSRELVHRINNFLTLCLTHGENALAGGSRAELSRALELILGGAESMATFVRSHRPDLAVSPSERSDHVR